MRYFILGGTGFVGRHLIAWLLRKQHAVQALARNEKSKASLPQGCEAIIGDPTQPGPWQDIAAQADVVVNLVGKSIMTRWNETAKKAILESRVLSTRLAVQAMERAGQGELSREQPGRKKVLINANAVGYYPQNMNREFAEDGPAGEGFLAEVAQKWQQEAEVARRGGARVVIARFGTVLGPDGGAMQQLLPVFRKGLGGRLGSGRQWFSWIHIHDLIRALEFMAEHDALDGPVNCCAPQAVTNQEFTRTLARIVRRPAVFPVPGPALRLVLGEVGSILTEGSKIHPKALLDAGFVFELGELERALRAIVQNKADAQ
jgi:uncharacterized protein